MESPDEREPSTEEDNQSHDEGNYILTEKELLILKEDREVENLYTLDGSVLEGGGQILRNSVSYSALLRRALRINNIRPGRSPPGLRMQHLKGIEVVRELCEGNIKGGAVSSTSMRLCPRQLKPSGVTLAVDIGTAGSITLLIQTVLPVLLFLPPSYVQQGSQAKTSVVTIIGGTNATHAPQIDYFQHVFLPVAERMLGVGRVSAEILSRGYYPRGGGKVHLEVTPFGTGESLLPIDFVTRGAITKISGYIFVGGVLPQAMAWEMHKQVLEDLSLEGLGQERFPSLDKDLRVVKERAQGGGSGLLLWAETEGGGIIAGSALGDRTKKSKAVAREATSQLMKNINEGGCVDEFLQDQLIILMALAKGHSRLLTGPMTLHTETALWIATSVAGVSVKRQSVDDGRRCMIEIEGIGFNST